MTAVRVLLALYPKTVRDRYGDEIAQLLADSPTPVRDAFDVAWHALTARGEHAMTFTVHRLPRAVLAVAAWITAVAALTFFADMVLTLHMSRWGGSASVVAPIARVITAFGVAATTVGAVAVGLRLGGAARATNPAVFLVPTIAVAMWLSSLFFIDHHFYVDTFLTAQGLRGAILPDALWLAAVLGVGLGVQQLTRLGRHSAARSVAVVGGIATVLMETLFTHLQISQYGDAGNPLLWYWRDLLALPAMRTYDGGVIYTSVSAWLCPVLTAVALAFIVGAARRASSAAFPVPVQPATMML
jgi:hypothetical protein